MDVRNQLSYIKKFRLAELVNWDEERLFNLLSAQALYKILGHFTKHYKGYHGNPLKEGCDAARLQYFHEVLFTCQHV